MYHRNFMTVLALTVMSLAVVGSVQADVLERIASFDFEGAPSTHPGELEPGYQLISPETDEYSAGQGFGFVTLDGASGVGGRTRGGVDKRLKEFMFIEGIEPQFRVDVDNGAYQFDSWHGEMDYSRTVRLEVSGDGGSNWTLYGADTSANPVAPLPGTFLTTFADSGTPGDFLQSIANNSNSYANYQVGARQFLQVHHSVDVTSGHILFRIGSSDRIYNAIEISRVIPEPSSLLALAGIGGLMFLRRKA